jgi:tripartite-type tricarboxylate transporter receptor subunit TctC
MAGRDGVGHQEMTGRAGDDIFAFLKDSRLIVPFPVGGSTGHTASVLARALERDVGAALGLEYQIGDFGLTALRALVRSDDGHALMIGNNITASMTPVLRRDSMGFDFEVEVVPLTKLAEYPSILMVNAGLALHSIEALFEHCRRRDGVLRYASDFLGTYVDVDALELAGRGGLTAALHEAGSANGVLAALVVGEVDMLMMNGATAAANRGSFRPLAVASLKRLASLPDVPTMAEAGYQGIGIVQWQGLFASSRLRPKLIGQLHDAVVEAMKTRSAREALQAVDASVVTSASTAAFAAEIRAEMARWQALRPKILGMPRI